MLPHPSFFVVFIVFRLLFSLVSFSSVYSSHKYMNTNQNHNVMGMCLHYCSSLKTAVFTSKMKYVRYFFHIANVISQSVMFQICTVDEYRYRKECMLDLLNLPFSCFKSLRIVYLSWTCFWQASILSLSEDSILCQLQTVNVSDRVRRILVEIQRLFHSIVVLLRFLTNFVITI